MVSLGRMKTPPICGGRDWRRADGSHFLERRAGAGHPEPDRPHSDMPFRRHRLKPSSEGLPGGAACVLEGSLVSLRVAEAGRSCRIHSSWWETTRQEPPIPRSKRPTGRKSLHPIILYGNHIPGTAILWHSNLCSPGTKSAVPRPSGTAAPVPGAVLGQASIGHGQTPCNMMADGFLPVIFHGFLQEPMPRRPPCPWN